MTLPTDIGLPFSGTFLRPLPFQFNYPIREGFNFSTDVITADDGTEQRLAIRNPDRPRHTLNATFVCFERDEAHHLEALLYGWNAQAYGVPMWQDSMRLVADVAMGDFEFTVDDSTGRDLEQRVADEEDVPCLLWRAHDDYEPFILTSNADGTLTARDPVLGDWSKQNTLVIPLQLMYLASDPEIVRPAQSMLTVALSFISGQTPADLACLTSTEEVVGLRAQMVRPMGHMAMSGQGSLADNNDANAGALHPQSTDLVHDLFGYSAGVQIITDGDNGGPGWPTDVTGTSQTMHNMKRVMYPPSLGRVSGFSKCTVKCPASHLEQIFALGLSDAARGSVGGAAPVAGTDYTLGAYRLAASTAVGGLPLFSGKTVVESGFTGTGYFPAPSAPTGRSWVAVRASPTGGVIRIISIGTSGSDVTSYARYDVGAPGGLDGFTLAAECPASSHYVQMPHGYTIRLKDIARYKGVKIVTEEVLYSTGAPDWIESGSFGTPNVTTHDFTSDDYTAALPAGDGAYVTVAAGSTNLVGGAHDLMGDGSASGYNHGTDHELFRVTVSLYDFETIPNVFEQWIDIFPTQITSMNVGT